MSEPADRSDSRPAPGLLTVREFARFLGASEKTVRRLIASGQLRCVRFGRAVRIDPGDVSRWLSAHKE